MKYLILLLLLSGCCGYHNENLSLKLDCNGALQVVNAQTLLSTKPQCTTELVYDFK